MVEPKLGAIWTLTADGPRAGEPVVVAGVGPSGGFLVARLVAHVEDEALGYIPITPEQLRWHSDEGRVVRALACMLLAPVARDGLAARVGVVAPAVQDALADAVRRTSARAVMERIARPEPVVRRAAPTDNFLADLDAAHELADAFWAAVHAEDLAALARPQPRESLLRTLGMRLVRSFAGGLHAQLADPGGRRSRSSADGALTVEAVPGRPGVTRVQVIAAELDLGDDGGQLLVLGPGGELIAHVDLPPGEPVVIAELDLDPAVALSDDVRHEVAAFEEPA